MTLETGPEHAPWPKGLEAWEPELALFSRELVGHLSSLSERLFNAIGPLPVRSEQRVDEPNGYGALSRRGPYERLLVSEWALQLEAPDEFIRRASSGEQLFIELERRAPAGALEAWLLLDTGPSQLGMPRIAQLAALVAFTRRAREAGVFLRWAPLWYFEVPEYRALTPQTVHGWLESRVANEPNAGVLQQWANLLAPAAGLEREVWVVGAPRLAPLAARHGWQVLTLEEAADDTAASLEARVLRTTGTKSKRPQRPLTLTLPDQATAVRLLRNPFEWKQPKTPPPEPKKNRAPLELVSDTQLVFSLDSHRLLVRTIEGSVAALPVPNTVRAPYGWPTVAQLPPRTSLVAVLWKSRRERHVLLADDKTGQMRQASWQGGHEFAHTALGTIGTRRPLKHELWVSGLPAHPGFELRGRWFAFAKGGLDEQVHHARVCPGQLVLVSADNDLGHVAISEPHPSALPQSHWYIEPGSMKVVCAWQGEPVVVAQYETKFVVATRQGQTPQVKTLSAFAFEDNELQAVIASGRPDGIEIISLVNDRRGIQALRPFSPTQAQPQWEKITRSRAPIKAMAVSPNGECIAWRDETGEIAVYSRKRQTTVLRIQVRDAATELP